MPARKPFLVLLLRATLPLAALLAVSWLAGFAWFVRQAAFPPALPPHADGIVALTGGADRIPAAVALLAQGRAGKLLISGVSPAVTLANIGVNDPDLADRITLGRAAVTTAGNAEETASWAGDAGLHSLIVVTASYHMPRALAELGHALPDVALYPMPVTPPGLRLRLMIGEYNKFLAAKLGLGRVAPGLRE